MPPWSNQYQRHVTNHARGPLAPGLPWSNHSIAVLWLSLPAIGPLVNRKLDGKSGRARAQRMTLLVGTSLNRLLPDRVAVLEGRR